MRFWRIIGRPPHAVPGDERPRIMRWSAAASVACSVIAGVGAAYAEWLLVAPMTLFALVQALQATVLSAEQDWSERYGARIRRPHAGLRASSQEWDAIEAFIDKEKGPRA